MSNFNILQYTKLHFIYKPCYLIGILGTLSAKAGVAVKYVGKSAIVSVAILSASCFKSEKGLQN